MIIGGSLVCGNESASKILSIGGQEVQITNPDKLSLLRKTKVTKLKLVQYYSTVGVRS
jgi:DNA primase